MLYPLLYCVEPYTYVYIHECTMWSILRGEGGFEPPHYHKGGTLCLTLLYENTQLLPCVSPFYRKELCLLSLYYDSVLTGITAILLCNLTKVDGGTSS